MDAMIKVRNLRKSFKSFKRAEGFFGAIKNLYSRDYKEVPAVNDINFDIQEGEVVGYIGPNGAGKSTTVKMLSGILTPTSGSILINGIEPYRDRLVNAQQIGVLFGQRSQLWWDLAVVESYYLLKKIYQVSNENYERVLNRCKSVLGLEEFLHMPVRKLSLGQRMRADLAASLLHSPRVIFLDEPSIGLDVDVKEKIREFIKDINREFKTTIILTTHDLGDIEELCDRIMIIDKGKILFDGKLAIIFERYSPRRRVTFELRDSAKDEGAWQHLLDRKFADGHTGNDTPKPQLPSPNKLAVSFDRNLHSAPEIIQTVFENAQVLDLAIEEPDIEEIIRRIYREGMANAQTSGGGV